MSPNNRGVRPCTRLLTERTEIKNTLVVVISGDRGLAGAYNTNLIRFVARKFGKHPTPCA